MSIVAYDPDGSGSNRRDRLAVRQAQNEIVRHSRNAAVKAAKEQIDVTTSADAVRGCLEEEIYLLQYGKLRAGDDKRAQELVLRKVVNFAGRNDIRLIGKGF